MVRNTQGYRKDLNLSETEEDQKAIDALAGAGTAVLYADSGSAGTAFVYIKNTNTSNSYSIDLKTDGASTYGTLDNGEFAFIPIDTNEGLEVTAAGGTVAVEYAYWTKG